MYMNLKEALTQEKSRYNEYGQDSEEVHRNAKERQESHNRTQQPKSYDELR